MHNSKQYPSQNRRTIRPAASILLALAASSFSFAQSATETKPDAAAAGTVPTDNEVVVMDAFKVSGGFRGSLAAAAEEKQGLQVVAEVVHAEDLGKLPDISIAETLTRLPGLTTQRLNGRAQAIVIRGLNGDFSTALLNGRQQVSTNSGRSVEFDQYPAELLNNVVVYKTTDASLTGQGLSGTVDLQTIRPLKSSKRAIAINTFYEWTGLKPDNCDGKRGGLRHAISYVDQFADGKVGVSVGISLSKRPGQGEQFNAWGYPNAFYDSSKPFVLGGAKPFIRSSELDRDGYMATIEFAPSDLVHSTVDIFYTDFQEIQRLRGVEIPLQWSSAALQPGYTAENGLITKGTFNNIYGVVRNDYVRRNDHLFAGGWNTQIGDKHGWLATVDLSYSRVRRTDFVLETYSGFAANQVGKADTMTYTLPGDGGAMFTHVLDYSNANNDMMLGSAQGWGYDSATRPYGQDGFVKGPIARDEMAQYQFKVEHPLKGFFSRFESGLTWNRRAKYETESGPNGMEGYFLQLKNKAASAPMPAKIGLSDLSFIGLGKMYSYDPVALYESGFYEKQANNSPTTMANNWDVLEKIATFHAKLDIDTKVGGLPITGNIGGQLIHTDQNTGGQAINTSTLTITEVRGGSKYWDFVPTLNLNFHLSDNDSIRLGVARQLARQQMNDMRAGSTFSFNQALANSTDITSSPWSANGGNPKLEPWRSNSIDVSYEHYFKDHMGYWSIASFYKKLVSYTYTSKTLTDFTGLPTGVEGVTPKLWQGYSYVPENGQGGFIKGLELTVSLPGEKFTPVLKGFGVIASTSFFRSSIQPDLGSPSTPLVGLSDRVSSGTLYYERGGFSIRTSARYRSSYRGDIATFGPRGAVYRNLQAETVVDAQISYAFKKGSLKGLTLIAQAYNLTDEPLNASSGSDARYVQDFQIYGANYSVGASYKF